MKVYQLLEKLSEHPAGAEVRIWSSRKAEACDDGKGYCKINSVDTNNENESSERPLDILLNDLWTEE